MKQTSGYIIVRKSGRFAFGRYKSITGQVTESGPMQIYDSKRFAKSLLWEGEKIEKCKVTVVKS